MKAIKLLNIGTLDGVTRLQSQLCVGKDSVDFIQEDGVLKNWTNGKNGFGFYPTDMPHQIVMNKKEMILQQL